MGNLCVSSRRQQLPLDTLWYSMTQVCLVAGKKEPLMYIHSVLFIELVVSDSHYMYIWQKRYSLRMIIFQYLFTLCWDKIKTIHASVARTIFERWKACALSIYAIFSPITYTSNQRIYSSISIILFILRYYYRVTINTMF